MEELEQEAQLHVFVRMGVESTLERSQTTRENLGLLLVQLLQSGTLPKEQLFRGCVSLLCPPHLSTFHFSHTQKVPQINFLYFSPPVLKSMQESSINI